MTRRKVKSGEVDFKKNFCIRNFDRKSWSLDVLNQVDVLLQDKKGNYILYIESKASITGEAQHREAIALAKKINRQLVEQHLLLWERENIY